MSAAWVAVDGGWRAGPVVWWWLAAAVVTAVPRPRGGAVRSWALVGSSRGPVRGRDRRRLDRRVVIASGIVCCTGLAVVTGPVLALTAALVLATVGPAIGRHRDRRGGARVDRDALAAVRFLRGELAAGSGESAALRAAGAVAGELAGTFRAAAAAATHGGDVARVFDGHDPPTPAIGALARAWRVRAECGASLVAVIGRVEEDLTDRAATRRAVASALAGPRSSALVLAGLPVVGVVMGVGMGARPMSFLLDRGIGSMVLLVGVALDALGLWWTDRMTRRAEP